MLLLLLFAIVLNGVRRPDFERTLGGACVDRRDLDECDRKCLVESCIEKMETD
jgi:hypothetical protein